MSTAMAINPWTKLLSITFVPTLLAVTLACKSPSETTENGTGSDTIPPVLISADLMAEGVDVTKKARLASHLLARIKNSAKNEFVSYGSIDLDDAGTISDELENIAAGKTSVVESNLLTVVVAIAVAGLDQRLTSLTAVKHEEGSEHKAGRAIDLEPDPMVFAFLYDNRAELCLDGLILMPPDLWPSGTHNLYRGRPGNANAANIKDRIHCSILMDCTISNRLQPLRESANNADPPIARKSGEGLLTPLEAADEKNKECPEAQGLCTCDDTSGCETTWAFDRCRAPEPDNFPPYREWLQLHLGPGELDCE